MKNILITGGAGFIGSHVVEHFANRYPDYQIVVMDCLTYAANVDFFKELEIKFSNVITLQQDIRDYKACQWIIKDFKIDGIIHLAAESHVDNSIHNPFAFAETNVMGTLNLLNAAKEAWKDDMNGKLFYHISTDEVYGALGSEGYFYETTPYDPKSPYSASKASSDHFVMSYYNTHGLPVIISNCSNNYGERQHKEKLLPKAINNLLKGKKIPIYGKGENVRDWLYVKEHVRAMDMLFHNGRAGQSYNIGGDCEYRNIDIIKLLIEIHLNSSVFNIEDYVEFVEDRKGHDFRYAINHDKITKEIGWKPDTYFMFGLKLTYDYYKNLI